MNIAILLIVLILVILVLFLLFNSKNTKTKQKSHHSNQIKKANETFNIYLAEIPDKVQELEMEEILQNIAERFEVFKMLKYLNKKDTELHINEWNSWEVSQLIYALQEERNILIPEPSTIFHKSILKMTKKEIDEEMINIVLKLNKIQLKEPIQLKNHVVWTAREISMIFYYFILIREF